MNSPKKIIKVITANNKKPIFNVFTLHFSVMKTAEQLRNIVKIFRNAYFDYLNS